ncbi:hypothetical protein AUK40_04930 [Candidatus Wirthbacteria bacterium CG2_30_54_11]|uniref:ECF transporter S component n=1 Tax=Candidatus Wirthbacteria bacterium CG2_30_54_11 TaxID=1817892 RepID=A0A1J5IHA7_9BACT|nr:MAG: hypothetical protein AUK40_04930 [Candidatus Wirthbacteria bacterium CG2_30_54_11]
MTSILKRGFGSKAAAKQNILAFVICVALGFVALQIPFTHIIGTTRSFTLFDLLAPAMGALWGMTVGLASVLFINLFNLVMTGDYSTGALIRLVPVLFGVYYFARRSRASAWVGIVCMVLFIAHPVGRQAWMYSLYWLIPLFTQLLGRKNAALSALGATFTQHAVGGVAFLYAYSFTPAYWKALIPVVAGERLVLAIGITVSYVVLQSVVSALKLRVPGFQKARSFLGMNS